MAYGYNPKGYGSGKVSYTGRPSTSSVLDRVYTNIRKKEHLAREEQRLRAEALERAGR